jgi:hypothetical protein
MNEEEIQEKERIIVKNQGKRNTNTKPNGMKYQNGKWQKICCLCSHL